MCSECGKDLGHRFGAQRAGFLVGSYWVPLGFRSGFLLGFVLGPYWVPNVVKVLEIDLVRRGLGSCWVLIGFLLDSFWFPIGLLLGSYWGPIGFLLDSYWVPIGFLLGSYWVPIGFLLVSGCFRLVSNWPPTGSR